MAPSAVRKCSGPSLPLGFSASRIWRLIVPLMALSPLADMSCSLLVQTCACELGSCPDCAPPIHFTPELHWQIRRTEPRHVAELPKSARLGSAGILGVRECRTGS